MSVRRGCLCDKAPARASKVITEETLDLWAFPAYQMFHQNSPEILPPSRLILIAPAGAMCRRRPFALAQKGGRKPINAKCETFRTLPSFQEAYRKRRCILPVDGFFEWKAIKGQKAKQPYAIAMKDGSPFGIGGLWENWKDPTSGEWVRPFAIHHNGCQ